MLWPSTRATWNPNVTMSVAYTAADASVFNQATTSSTMRLTPNPLVSAGTRDSSEMIIPPAMAGTGSAATRGSGATSGSTAGTGCNAAYASYESDCGAGSQL